MLAPALHAITNFVPSPICSAIWRVRLFTARHTCRPFASAGSFRLVLATNARSSREVCPLSVILQLALLQHFTRSYIGSETLITGHDEKPSFINAI
jgi:hypothetical protein